MVIDIIPTGASAVVTSDRDSDRYNSAERVKDRVAALDVAEAERFHKVTEELGQIDSEILRSLYTSVNDVETHVSKDIRDSQTDVVRSVSDGESRTTKSITDSAVALTKATTDSSFASSLSFATVLNGQTSGFKDARYDAATLSASIQAALCAGFQAVNANIAEASKENVMLFKDAELRAARESKELALSLKDSELMALKNKCELSAQIAACCCEMKQEVGGVKDALKQQEIDNLRMMLDDAKRSH